MKFWDLAALTRVVPALTPVSVGEREAILKGPANAGDHAGHYDRLQVLREIEAGGPGTAELAGPVRILAWNVERLRHGDDICRTLRRENCDVILLSEVDRGMARSGNLDTIRRLSNELGMGFVYAVEFVELGLGDLAEQRTHAGETNLQGLHGAAILSRTQLERPFLIRIDRRGDWFDGRHGERRVGGTIGLAARVRAAGSEMTVVSVHLESHCDPVLRAADMERLLHCVDEQVGMASAVILGGDFNTSTGSALERHEDPARWQARRLSEPERLTNPARWEPLFAAASRHGYDWRRSNVPDVPTQRFRENDPRLPAKLDWIFTRGLQALQPRVVPALRGEGSPSSDHDAIVVATELS